MAKKSGKAAEIKKFKKGEIIAPQGEIDGCAYFIKKGRVEVFVKRPKQVDYHIASFEKGTVVGETALIEKQPRSATLRAMEDCELEEICKDTFLDKIKNGDETIKLVSQAIINRLQNMTLRAEILGSKIDNPCIDDLELEYADKSFVLEDEEIAKEFEKALKEQELHLRYQPIINIRSGKISGFEALMRWEHPEKGYIPPGIFIPIAEQSGLMAKASLWALKEACETYKRFIGQVGYDQDLFMSVNFSSNDLKQDNFIESVYDILSRTDMDPTALKLEITERMLVSQPENALAVLGQCREAGIDIVIDDFGTGYSSLTYLNAFPINVMKIDRSFIRKALDTPNSKKWIKSLTAMAQILGIEIIAEGAESLEEAALLRNMGCDMVQGYFYAKPLQEKEIAMLIRQWQPIKL